LILVLRHFPEVGVDIGWREAVNTRLMISAYHLSEAIEAAFPASPAWGSI
jgi:hypothetical protein